MFGRPAVAGLAIKEKKAPPVWWGLGTLRVLYRERHFGTSHVREYFPRWRRFLFNNFHKRVVDWHTTVLETIDNSPESIVVAGASENDVPLCEDIFQLQRLIFLQLNEQGIVCRCLLFACLDASGKNVRVNTLHMHENFQCAEVFLRIFCIHSHKDVMHAFVACHTTEVFHPDTAFGVTTARSRADKRRSDNPSCWLSGVTAYETASSNAGNYIVIYCNQVLLLYKELFKLTKKAPNNGAFLPFPSKSRI